MLDVPIFLYSNTARPSRNLLSDCSHSRDSGIRRISQHVPTCVRKFRSILGHRNIAVPAPSNPPCAGISKTTSGTQAAIALSTKFVLPSTTLAARRRPQESCAPRKADPLILRRLRHARSYFIFRQGPPCKTRHVSRRDLDQALLDPQDTIAHQRCAAPPETIASATPCLRSSASVHR